MFLSHLVSHTAMYAYYDYLEANDLIDSSNDTYDDMETWLMLLGAGSLIMLITLAVETLLGFCNMDDNKCWGFLFMIASAGTIVLTSAGASLAIDTESVAAVPDTAEKGDNVWYFYFALLSSPLPIRFLGIFLKFKDVTRGGE